MTSYESAPLGDEPTEVAIASSRPAVVAAWMARLAHEPSLRMSGLSIADPHGLEETLAVSKPHVLLLDVASLEWLGVEGAQRVRANYPGLRVLLVCDGAGPQLVELVLSHRFQGYLASHDRPELCVKAIMGARHGELWLPRAGLAEALYSRCGYRDAHLMTEGSHRLVRASLTEREQQVASCLGKGSTNTEIARELGIKKDTVKKHLRSLFGKLGVNRRTQIAVLLQAGRLPPAPAKSRSTA